MMDEKRLQKNVLGEKIENCSEEPLTGWFRDGCCNTNDEDRGIHTVCAKVTTKFLEWGKTVGNDLVTPHPEFGFPGLKDGDRWCLCAARWEEARMAGKAPKVILEATNIKCLDICDLEHLKKHSGGN